VSFCITIWKREHAYKFTRWCDPPWGKHRQLARQVGVLHVFYRFPIPFEMATLTSPIPCSTVIWFGSLEFMSTGSGYDMILLSIKGLGGARVAPARLMAPRRPRHHASPPKKRRGQHHRRLFGSSRPAIRARQEVTQESTAPRAATVSMTTQRREDHTMTGGDAPRALSPTARLLPHGLFALRSALPFSLDNAAASLARAICPNAQTYVERPMVLPRDPGAQRPTSELLDFSQVRGLRRLGPRQYMITSLGQLLLEEGRRCFHAAEPNSGLESDSHDPTRECFHIDGAVETTDETQDAVAGRQAPAAREDPRTPGIEVRSTPLRKKTEPRKLRSYESSRQSLTRIASNNAAAKHARTVELPSSTHPR